MKIHHLLLSFLLVHTLISDSPACGVDHKKTVKRADLKKLLGVKRKIATDEIPNFSAGHASPSLETKLANLLLKNEKVVISIPVSLKMSQYHPFGDGQSNAKLELGQHWKESDFLVTGYETTNADGAKSRRYEFHPKLNIKNYKETKLQDGWYQVVPEGWNDSFYFNYNSEILKVGDFVSGIPAEYRTFAEGRTAPDPAKVSGPNPLSTLNTSNLGTGYNSDPWYSDNVHGKFPDQNGTATALGGVYTWGIVDRKFGPFKHLYTCFEARKIQEETKLGIPSGAGWHHIGDAAETVLNTLESAAIPVAVARNIPSGKSAYDLNQSLTGTWLKSQEVFVSRKGEFHWYVNPHQKEVCTEIWVHNCVPGPNNSWGFNCN